MSHLSNVKYSSGDWRNNNSDAVAVGIYDDLNLSRQLQGVNRELGRGISNALSANLIKGKIGEVQIVIGKKGTVLEKLPQVYQNCVLPIRLVPLVF